MTEGRVRYSDGKSAAVYQVDLRWGERELDILAGDGSILDRWAFDDIRELPMPGREDCLQIIDGHGVGGRLRLEEAGDIDKCRRLCKALSQQPDKEPGWWKAYVFWSVTAVGSLALLFMVIIPSLAHQIAKIIPYNWEQELGANVEQSILSVLARYQEKETAELICSSTAGLRALDKMTTPLSYGSDNLLDIKVTVINVDMANAITLPGGRIIVFKGLLDKADHPNEVAGVIGHEIGHVVHHHSMESFISTTAITGLLSLLVGDASGGIVIAGVTEMALNSANSRDAEREADDYGIGVMNELGFDAKPLAVMLGKLGKETPKIAVMDWLSSHPGMSERIDHINAVNTQNGASLSDADWQALKTICQ